MAQKGITNNRASEHVQGWVSFVDFRAVSLKGVLAYRSVRLSDSVSDDGFAVDEVDVDMPGSHEAWMQSMPPLVQRQSAFSRL